MKRFLSLLLALTLVIALAPAAFASEGEGEAEFDGYNFQFFPSAHEGTDNHPSTSVHSFANINDGFDPWAVVGFSGEYDDNTQFQENNGGRLLLQFTRPGGNGSGTVTFSPDMTGTASAFCFELKITTGGRFAPSVKWGNTGLSGIAELYLVPRSVEGDITAANLSDKVKGLDAKYRIGVVDFNKAYSAASAVKMRSVNLNDDDNCYFIIVPNGQNADASSDSTVSQFILYNLALTPVKPEPVSYVYDFSIDQKTGGIDLDTDGDGPDGGLTDTLKNDNGSYLSSTTNLKAYTHINTANSENWAHVTHNGSTSSSIRFYEDGLCYNNKQASDTTGDAFALFKIQVDEADTYEIYFTKGGHCDATSKVMLSLFAVDDSFTPVSNKNSLPKITANEIGSEIDFATATDETYVDTLTLSEGEYYLGIRCTNSKESTSKFGFKTIRLASTTKPGTYPEEIGDEYVNVDPENAEAEAGKATISSQVSVLAKDTDGNEIDVAITPVGNSVTAEQTVGEYKFLYWAKGIGAHQKKVSTNLTYEFNKETEKLWLFAVYHNPTTAAEKATFYNANGDLLKEVEIAEGKVTIPSLDGVSLVGYGAANGWKYSIDEVVYKAGDEVEVGSNALFVADYDDIDAQIDITVTSGTMAVEGGETTPLFGDKVKVTAPLRKDNTQLFNYWMKGDEIVSFDNVYEFVAWEDCTLTPVYSDYVPVADTVRKIILGEVVNDGETTVIAEFIGLDNAVERGIAFGENASVSSINRVIMSSKDKNHLAAIDDIEKGYVGYAIMSDGTIYYSK